MWPLRSIFFFVVFWATCFAALTNPVWGLINYMLVYQINPANTWWGKPLTDLGIRFSLVAAVFTVAGLFIARRTVPIVRPAISMWEIGAVLLVLIAGINLAVAVPPDDISYFIFEKLWKVVIFIMILTRLASTRENLRVVIWTLVAGTMYIGYDAYTAPEWRFVLGRLDKVGGPDISTTSGVAAHLVAMLPLIGTAFLTSSLWRTRLFALLSGALAVNTVVMCRTRSAFIGFACGVAAAFLLTPRARRFRIHALIVIGAIAAFSLTDQNFWDRMATLTTRSTFETDRAAATRMEIWQASLRIFQDHPFGIGVGNFARVIGYYDERHYKRDTHNSLVECFVELGVQGGVVFLLMVSGSMWFLWRSVKLADQTRNPLETRIFAYGFFVSFITYFVTAMGTQRLYCESFWWVLSLPLCLYRVVRREMEQEATETSDAPEGAGEAESPSLVGVSPDDMPLVLPWEAKRNVPAPGGS